MKKIARNKSSFLSLLILFLLLAPAQADVRLAGIFGDHAVLQRDKSVPIWGWAEPSEMVTLRFADQEKKTTAGADGRWRVTLDAMKANAVSRELVVSGSNMVILSDIVVGDVWLCSGQSNMAWPLSKAADAQAEVAAADYPLIRHAGVPRSPQTSPVDDIVSSAWSVCSPGSAGQFSAVAYFFARELHRALGLPIGLLDSSVGGSPIEAWLPPSVFETLSELKEMAPGAGLEPPASIPADTWKHRGELFNGMIYPVVPYAIRGVIWYQGEKNGHLGEGLSYLHKQRALIGSWRELFGQGDFPFYYVQLAKFGPPNTNSPAGDNGWPRLREAQRLCLAVPRTGMAIALDVGEAANIHPANKQDVGYRLARRAMADEYGREIVGGGPLYKACVFEGDKARISFHDAGSGLMVGSKSGTNPVVKAVGGKLGQFSIAGADGRFYWADAFIDGDTVVVSSVHVEEPTAVRYAYSSNPEGANLYNMEGFPASPFKTDN